MVMEERILISGWVEGNEGMKGEMGKHGGQKNVFLWLMSFTDIRKYLKKRFFLKFMQMDCN